MFIINFIVNQFMSRITSWQTTLPAGLVAYLTNALSAYIDPSYLHSFVGQVSQWLLYGASLVLLAWKNRKQPPEGNTPTPPPERENK